MSRSLAIRLLGVPEVLSRGEALDLSAVRAVPLVTLLSCTPSRIARERVAALLWRRVEPASALASLRQLLHHLPEALREAIQADRTSLVLDRTRAACDVWSLEGAAATGAGVATLLAVYRTPLLGGATFGDLPEFDDWLHPQRARLAALVREALRREIETVGSPAALALVEQWLAIEPADEPMHARAIAIHIEAGRLSAAERQYEELRRVLATGAGRAPEPATRALLEDAVRRTGRPKGAGIPALSTSFVGRQDELAELARLMADAHCRLVTLHGPGGVGKTRLALAFAEEAARFGDAVLFAGAESAHTTQAFFAAIATAFGIEISPRQDPAAALCEALRTHRGLLVLDNLEQLLPAAGGKPEVSLFIAELLRAALQIKILVTSRVALGLQEEWLIGIDGLPYPSDESVTAASASNDAAVELFVGRARQAYRGFSGSAELPHVLAICRAAGGLPLALELAAAQVGTRPCAEIARTLLDAAGPGLALNRPKRHASIRHVIDQSLAAASPEQARAFASLALFRGAFPAELAFAVARVGEGVLQELAGRALVRRDGKSFSLHPLLRQVALQRLARRRGIARRIEADFANEIGRRAEREDERLLGRESAQAMAGISGRFSDELAALRIAAVHGDAASVVRLATALAHTAQARGLVRACLEEWPDPAIEELPALARAVLRIRRADLRRQVGEYDRAIEDYDAASVDLAAAPSPELEYALRSGRAHAFIFRGDYAAVLAQFEAAVPAGEGSRAVSSATRFRAVAGTALMELGELERAGALLDEALAVAERSGVSAFVLVTVLNALGGLSHYRGDSAACVEWHRRALHLLEADGLRRMQAPHYCNLGGATMELGRLHEARDAFERAVSIAGTFGDRGPLAYSLSGLANAALRLGDLEAAERSASRARAVAAQIGSASLESEAVTILVRVALARGSRDRAVALLVEQEKATRGRDLGFRRLDVVLSAFMLAIDAANPPSHEFFASGVAALLAHPACTPAFASSVRAWVEQCGLPSRRVAPPVRPEEVLEQACAAAMAQLASAPVRD